MLVKFRRRRAPPPVMKMVVPGRRALGEQWQTVTIQPNEDGSRIEVEREPTTAPPMGLPIIIPAMGNLSADEVDFILEGALKASEYESHHPRRRPVTDTEIHGMVQQLWHDYFEQKVRAFTGTSQFGPAAKTQREGYGGDREHNRSNT